MSSKKIIQDNPFSLMPPEDRAGCDGHTLVLGAARAGKTRLAAIPISQDLRRDDKGGEP